MVTPILLKTNGTVIPAVLNTAYLTCQKQYRALMSVRVLSMSILEEEVFLTI